MDVALTPEDLLTPAGLGQFQMSFPDGRAMARIGLRMSFFFRRLDAPETRRALLECTRDYLRLSGPRMRSWALNGDRSWRKLKPGENPDLALLEQRIDQAGFGLELSEVPEPPNQAAHWSMLFRGGLITGREDELGYLVAYLPFTALEGAPPGSFRGLFLRWCDALAVEHAYGGIGWVLPVEVGAQNAAVSRLGEMALRFVALDVEQPGDVSSQCEEGIKCTAWLTAVSHRLLQRAGGAEAIAQAAGPDILLHPYGNGTVFQAGPAPQIGDAEQGIVPIAYLALGRALKPLRANYTWSIFDAPPGYVAPPGTDADIHMSQRWLSRFDGD